MTRSGVTTTYSYDALGRLASAAAPSWSQGFGYDDFGNLHTKTGTNAGSWTGTLNSERNQFGAHDEVGNPTGLSFDGENRLLAYQDETYVYASDNKRVLRTKSIGNVKELTLWSGGVRVGIYRFAYDEYWQKWNRTVVKEDVYIGGRRMAPADRLGSDLSHGKVYLPYGEELTATAQDADKWGTYRRDATGLDYADQRYYQPGWGRFLTGDPYQASAGAGSPGSWNRYAYVEGDPVNFLDPNGLDRIDPSEFLFRVTVTGRVGASGGGGGRFGDRYSAELMLDSGMHPFEQGGTGCVGPLASCNWAAALAQVQVETCSLAEHLTDECGDADTGFWAAAGSRWFMGGYVAWHIAARAVGAAGERAVQEVINLPKNTQAITGTLSGTSRVPDFWNRSTNTIIEVKNVSYLSFTAQLRDMAAWAASQGQKFELWVREGSALSPELQAAVDNGLVTLKSFTWP